MRNVWSFMIIFCGHFPDGTQEFTEEESENETRGQWYFRQLLGSANLTGGRLFHICPATSHQIEHHLFPDMPARRYAEIAPEVREICERYGIPYNTGPPPGSSDRSSARSSASLFPVAPRARCPPGGANGRRASHGGLKRRGLAAWRRPQVRDVPGPPR